MPPSSQPRGPFTPAPPGGVRPQYRFFGGKGGAGKTTCAAAAAVAAAARGRRVLVVSTDPAHSLGDVLGLALTAVPSRIPVPRGSLSACELDADRALDRWLAARRPALATILKRGTILDRADVEPFFDLSLPGVDELLGLLEIERLGTSGACDQVIVDTAPTGHTLRLLATPALLATIARVLDLMEEKHRVLASTFGRGPERDAAERLIDELRGDGERLDRLLRDPSRTQLCWVLLPEEMSVAESARALRALDATGLRVPDLIVNRVTPPPPSPCELCDGRRRTEGESLHVIWRRWRRDARLWMLPSFEVPARGVPALAPLADALAPLKPRKPAASRGSRRPRTRRRSLPHSVRVPRRMRLLIVGGKGGVGKTTCAAAIAAAAAREGSDRRVLLLSTDPAPSLGDALGEPIGDVERNLRHAPSNLSARELDAARDWQARRERYQRSIERFFDAIGAGSAVDLTVDRAIVEELFDLAPPGMDELSGMLTMIEALLEGSAPYDLVVVDSAPTGHTQRLLALPGQAQAWVRQVMAVVRKYRIAHGFAEIAAELVELSQGLRRLQALLKDPRACGFVVVTRAEQLPSLETLRLAEWLRQHRIPHRALVINAITPAGCARCHRAAARERRQIASLTRRADWQQAPVPIVLTPAVAAPPKGIAEIEAWAATWREIEETDGGNGGDGGNGITQRRGGTENGMPRVLRGRRRGRLRT